MGKKSTVNNVTTATSNSTSYNGSSITFPPIGGSKKPRKLSSPHVLIPDQVIMFPGALTEQECKDIINLFESHSNDFKLEPSPAARKGEAQRTSYRFSAISPNYAKQLYELTGIKEEIKFWNSMFPGSDIRPVGLSSNIRVYRYQPGDIFGAHYDDHNIDPHFGPSYGKSEWTLLLYLTGQEDGVEGGQTVFYRTHTVPKKKTGDNTIVAPLLRGAALFHRHGKVCMLHEALPPIKGVKWVLRSDVIFGKS